MSCVWFSAFGSIFLLVIINLLQNSGSDFDGFKALLPFILLIIAIINFWGESFIAPTKNYLVALGAGILAGAIIFLSTNHLFLVLELNQIASYYQLLPLLIGVVCGIIVGVIFYYILKPRRANWNQPLWQAKRLWDFINNKTLLFVVMTLAFIEGLLQLGSTSLLFLFTSL